MKKWVALLFVCIFANSFSQMNISPQFSELKGMEDQLGNTQLFYRIYSHNENFPIYSYTYNDIYHLDLNTFSDSLFLRDYIESSPVMMNAVTVNDYKFWNNNANEFIYVGMIGGQDPVPFISRFDQEYNLLNSFCCEVKTIDISSSDDSLIYSGGQMFVENQQSTTIRSFDGGFNWIPISDTLVFLSLNPFDDNLMFLEGFTGFLYRSTDGAKSFHLVDVLNEWAHSTSFIYDLDQLHIYRLFSNRTLRVSDDIGEPFSWQTKYSTDSKIFISIDQSVSGIIYLADEKNIFVSTDYGDNFTLCKTLDRKIVGIYKKSNFNKLYAATKYKIYEITPDTIQIIKSLPIPEEVFEWYPLSIGNFWVYEVFTSDIGGNEYHGDETIATIDTATMNNGLQYFLNKRTFINGDADTTFIRLDSLSGKLYAYSFETGNDLFFDDLLAEAGDTVCYEYNPVWNCQFVQPDSEFTEFGITASIKKYFPQAPGWYFGHSLVNGIGLYETYNGDIVTYNSTLKGCVIDGIVYGDTTVVSVEDEETPIATTFKLEQNYPNPFNPTTSIQYSIGSRQFVTLKVYDVLGNEIATIINEELPAGEYEVEFNGHSVEGRNLTSGVYFYQLRIGGPETSSGQKLIQTKKMIYLK